MPQGGTLTTLMHVILDLCGVSVGLGEIGVGSCAGYSTAGGMMVSGMVQQGGVAWE